MLLSFCLFFLPISVWRCLQKKHVNEKDFIEYIPVNLIHFFDFRFNLNFSISVALPRHNVGFQRMEGIVMASLELQKFYKDCSYQSESHPFISCVTKLFFGITKYYILTC